MFRGIGFRPWLPEGVARGFGGAVEQGTLAYLVVEEVDAAGVGVLVLSWPVVDEHGLLVFGDSEPARRLRLSPRELAGAESEVPRAGMVFAAQLADDGTAEGGGAGPFVGRPLDVTAEVRAFARGQARAAGEFAGG